MKPSLLLQYALPHRLLSGLVYRATRWSWRPWKNFLIRQISQRYQVNLDEAQHTELDAFPHFNAFFTRSLKPEARVPDPSSDVILQPADGIISQAGEIQEGRIFQAKGHDFSVSELIADTNQANIYTRGSFATIYLSPKDYHRVHMPMTGRLLETVHIPGRLFSVAPFTVAGIPRLFARNERLICHFDGGVAGQFVVALVGAMLVSSIETVWGGLEIPPYANTITRRNYRGQNRVLRQFDELGRFNMGSTVIVLFTPAAVMLEPKLKPGMSVQVGEKLGQIVNSAPIYSSHLHSPL